MAPCTTLNRKTIGHQKGTEDFQKVVAGGKCRQFRPFVEVVQIRLK